MGVGDRVSGKAIARIMELLREDKAAIPKVDNSFRGGSRGKGGKIKYARR